MSDFNYQLYKDNGFQEHDSNSYLLETGLPAHYTRYTDLDKFLTKVYNYFEGKGFRDIVLSRLLNIFSLVWVVGLATFLTSWVNYDILFTNYQFFEAIQFSGFHPLMVMSLFIFFIFLVLELLTLIWDIKDFWEISNFYRRELQITDGELPTIEWREVARRIIKVPRLCIVKEEMTVLDLANRIMRKENYLIALINKDILQLSLPLPFLSKRRVVTKTLEWSLSFCIFGYVFDPNNMDGLNPSVKDPSKQNALASGLRLRFRLLGLITLILSPFVFVFLLIYFTLEYGLVLRMRPAIFASRQWSPLARWKFRELNELRHIFQKRLNSSYDLAKKYAASFPDNKLAILARFVSFIVGSVVLLLLLIGLWDDDFFQVQLYDDRSVLWFIGVGGTIVAACRGVIPNEHSVFEPVKTMEELVQHTHYMPKSWRNKLHSLEVLGEFNQLFEFKIVIFFTEMMGVLLTPFILLISLPNCADKIIQFFREFTVNEEGVGDVCKFAVFPLDELGNRKYGADSNSIKRMQTKGGKMEKSFLNFKANHPDWKPSKAGEKYLNNLERNLNSSQIEPLNVESPPSLMMSSLPKDKVDMEASLRELNMIHRQFFRNNIGGLSEESKFL